MALTIKLQSPSFNNLNSGEELALPVAQDNYGINSLATVVSALGIRVAIDLLQDREVVRLAGFLTEATANQSKFWDSAGGVYRTVANAVELRDRLRRMRINWPLEDGSALTNWGQASFPTGEQDAAQARIVGQARLVYEVKYDRTTAAYVPFLLYGPVADITFPNRVAASGRTRIPFGVTFLVAVPATGA